MIPTKESLTLFLIFLIFHPSLSTDTISPSQPIKDGDVLISKGQKFELGFFSPGNSTTRRYVGIWYNKIPDQKIVWIANRDFPINDTSGVLSINTQGNLVLLSHNGTISVWSTNVSTGGPNVAMLQDSGNLVLMLQESQEISWQSFDHPTDTLLPNMKLGMNRKTGLVWALTSWKSLDDPGIGNVSFRFDPTGLPQAFLYKGQDRFWRAGPWNGLRLSGVPEMVENYIFNVSYVSNEDEFYLGYTMKNSSIISRMVVDQSGSVRRFTWRNQWFEFWSDPKEQCDYYGVCGPNSNCDPYQADSFMCQCLPGFKPRSPPDWYLRNGTAGCIRNVSTCQNGEGFVKLGLVRVPDTSTALVNMSLSLKACKEECLRNCSCSAYTVGDVVTGIGCLTWYGNLVDIRTYSGVGQDIYVRVDAAVLATYGKSKGILANNGVKAVVIVSAAVALLLIVFLVFWFIRRKRKAKEKSRPLFSLEISQVSSPSRHSGDSKKPFDNSGSSDLPSFDLSVIVAATNNFSNANKLGEGGFGAVYKGTLYNGKEIAVKRLSKNSGQGIDEFRNEVTLIARLQHRNLVRILGYCIQDQEKMLIYEYLPNKSLDSIVFDEMKSSSLDWPMRFNIICGIAKGLLYLHEDSRLRIIHRDLKASNVLLDASMNPKISDFGMARIFGVNQIEANTLRIVGTYGYMSPEYAMHGIFSVKSDVYSFGVLLLELVSGKKNSRFYEEASSSNLVGRVWDLWKENRGLEIIDETLGDSYSAQEILRCIHIGLLCVQESAVDRPNMSSVVFMLSNDTVLPFPKQPAFILKQIYSSGEPSTSGGVKSVNEVTITQLQAR